MKNSLHADDVLLNIASRPHKPVLGNKETQQLKIINGGKERSYQTARGVQGVREDQSD